MGRPVSFDFTTGGGSPEEFLMGTVHLEPTLMHTIGNTVVLPDAPYPVKLVNGKAVHPNVAVSPAGPEPAWAYRVTIKNELTGKAWSEFRGVPTGTTQIAYKELPKFVTTIPPHTTAGMMQNWADTTEANAERSELAADRAEAPTDLMNKNLIEDPASLTNAALNAAIAGPVQYAGGRRILSPNNMEMKNAATAQVTPTYDGTGQSIHPDVLYFPEGWRGYKYWHGTTPYPNGVATTENPSILVSNDGETWVVPPGTTNPLAAPPTGFWPDPDLTYEPSEDRIYYLFLGMRVMYTDDGVNWTVPHVIFPSITNEVSPAVVRETASDYRMWSCVRTDSGPHKILYREGNGLHAGSSWSAPEECTFTLPAGWGAWHIDVQKFGDTYVALLSVSAINTSGGGGTRLFAGTSADGKKWEFGTEPILTGIPGEWDGLDIYRACLLPASGPEAIADVWYSARSTSNIWGTGRTKLTYRDPALTQLAPTNAVATHRDTVIARPAPKNLLPSDVSASLLEPGTYTNAAARGPRGWVNNFLIINTTRNDWDTTREAFALGSNGGNNMYAEGIPVSVGQWYTFSYYMEAAAGVNATLAIHWIDAGGALVLANGGPITEGNGKEQRLQWSAVAPAGAVTAKVWINMPASNAGTRYIKRAQFERGRYATEWTPSVGQQFVTNGRDALQVYGPMTSEGRPTLFKVGGSGGVSVVRTPTSSLPNAAIAGRGTLAYDETRGAFVQSNGAAWVPVGGDCLAVVIKTANYTMSASDQVVIADGATNINTPLLANSPTGQVLRVKNINAATVIMATPDGVGIDGATTRNLLQWEVVTLINSGSKWLTI